MIPQSWRSTELIRRTPCCGSWAGARNGKIWCAACGQHLMRLSEALQAFKAPPEAPPPSDHLQGHVRRSQAVSAGQGTLL